MSISIKLEKVNYNNFVDKLMENQNITDRNLLEKIILEFGNKIGEDLVFMYNEYYEDGLCLFNMEEMITEIFNLEDDNYVTKVWYGLKEELISCVGIEEAYENLKLKRRG